jgi:hypothetical protein
MPQKTVVIAAAWLEIVVGASIVTVPNVPCRLLFATTPEGVGIPLARFAGVALVALGIACLPSKAAGSPRSAVLGLLVFNVGATVLLAWVAIANTFRGIVLWPVVVLHALIAAALLTQFLTRDAPLVDSSSQRSTTLSTDAIAARTRPRAGNS